jgi:hypothetical protein
MKLEKSIHTKKNHDKSLLEFEDSGILIKAKNEYTFPVSTLSEDHKEIQFFYDSFISETECILKEHNHPSHIHFNELSILFSINFHDTQYVLTLTKEEYKLICMDKYYLDLANLIDLFIKNSAYVPSYFSELYEEIKNMIK